MVWSPQERMIWTKPWAALMSEGWWRDATAGTHLLGIPCVCDADMHKHHL